MKRILLVISVLAFISCEKEADIPGQGGEISDKQFVASIGAYDSKTSLEECKVSWVKGDAISIFDEAGHNFKFVAKNDGATSIFEQSPDTPGIPSGSVFYSVYPFSAEASLSGSSISCSSPISYSAAPGSFANADASIMTAKASGNQLVFKNLSSLLRFTIPSNSEISSLYIFGSGSDLAGSVKINISSDGIPVVEQAPSSGNGITITPSGGNTFAAGVYFVPILPATYNSFRMRINYNSGSDNVSDAFSLDEMCAERNKLIDIGIVYDGRDWYRWLTFENGVATCSYITEGNPGSLSALDNPCATSSNSSNKVLRDQKLNGSTSAYFTIGIRNIDETVRSRMKAIKYQIYLGENEYYPRLVFNGGLKYLPTSINGIKPSGDKWTEAEWKTAVKTNDWNTFCHSISQFTDASTWKTSASTIEIRPLSNFTGGNITDQTISPTNTRTVYIDNFGFSYTEIPAVRPEDKGYIQISAKNKISDDPTKEYWSNYPTLITDNLGYIPVPEKLNRYGSLSNGPTFSATGFFHTQKYNGRWVVVDPEGHMHIISGVNSIAPGGGEDQNSAYKNKYGSDKTKWFSETAELLWNSGFSCAGAWSDWDAVKKYNSAHPERQISYCPNMDLMANYQSSKGYSMTNKLIYVFDPDFITWCENKIPAFVGQFINDPNILGYFSDNELPILVGSLKNYLTLPSSDYGRKAAEAWLEEKGIEPDQITDAIGREFAGYVANKYYSIVVPLFKQYDPNHMFIGSRYSGTTKTIEGAYKSAGSWCDIISMNYYGYWDVRDSDIQKWESWTDKPFIITEFYTKGEDSGLPNNTGDGWLVHTQLDRGYHYENFVIKLLRSKQCVGWHWFKYQDNDPTALHPSASNIDSNKGIVDNSYNEYTTLTERMKKVNFIRHSLSQL